MGTRCTECGAIMPYHRKACSRRVEYPPFDGAQIDNMNRFQRAGLMRPLTCPDDDTELVATCEGWVCHHCTRTLRWAHHWMASGEGLRYLRAMIG